MLGEDQRLEAALLDEGGELAGADRIRGGEISDAEVHLALIFISVSERASTIVFFPEGAFGPTNNCVGIGDVLRRRGHRVVFIVEESFAGTLEAQGFEERTMRLTPPPETEEAPGQFWKDFIRDTAPVFRKPTIDQLGEFIAPTFQALIDGAKYVDARLTEILGELEPDLVVEDNVVTFPALFASGRPWARIDSCNPLEIKDPDLPPVFSGLPSEDRSAWGEFWDAYRAAHGEMHADFDEFCRERGAPPLPRDDFIHASPTLNLYLYPTEVDYPRREPLGPTWHNLEASVRATDPDWRLPEDLAGGEEPLVYLSLGCLGSADVELMRTLVAELAEAPYRFIVSKGPQADEFDLAPNMVGAEFLPQTSVLPQVDLVDHPRRQQHRHRVALLRQADGRPADLLGPARQRPAPRRDRLRHPRRHLRPRPRRPPRRDRPPSRRRRPRRPSGPDFPPPAVGTRYGARRRPDRARRGQLRLTVTTATECVQRFDTLRATCACLRPSVEGVPWPPRVGELLPRWDEPLGIEEKLRTYSLDMDHEEGGSKANGFLVMLGIDLDSIDHLEGQILVGIGRTPISVVRPGAPGIVLCTVQFRIAGPGRYSDRTASLRTGWELTGPMDRPRLTTHS